MLASSTTVLILIPTISTTPTLTLSPLAASQFLHYHPIDTVAILPFSFSPDHIFKHGGLGGKHVVMHHMHT